MLNRLAIVVLETTLCIFRMVDAAKRELARDYPKMRSTPIKDSLPSQAVLSCWCSNGRLADDMPKTHAKSCTSMAHDWRDAERSSYRPEDQWEVR